MGVYGAATAGATAATATSWDVLQPHIIGTPGQVPEIIHGLYEANSQSFKAGSLVYLSSGAVTAAAEGGPIMGIAMKDATNVTSGNIEIPVMVAPLGADWQINVANGSGVYEAANTTAVLGGTYDIDNTTAVTKVNKLASDDSTGSQFVVVGWIYDEDGDITTLARVRQLPIESQAHSG